MSAHKVYLKEARDLLPSSSEADEIFMHVLGIDFTKLHLEDLILDEQQKILIRQMISRRLKGEPLSYITNSKEFFGYNFKVTEDTLIPRPETEILVDEVIKCFTKSARAEARILDLCTGTGCVAISLSKRLREMGYEVATTALDISHEAVEIAKYNATMLCVKEQINFVCCDLNDFLADSTAFNIIVSNPPYIPSSDINFLDSSVKDYEPHIALDGGQDGLKFFRRILALINDMSSPGCIIGFECGIGQAPAIVDMMHGFNKTTIVDDLAGIQRVVIAEK